MENHWILDVILLVPHSHPDPTCPMCGDNPQIPLTQIDSLDVVTSNRKIRRSAVPQWIRSGCVSLTDFKTAVGMQRGRVNIPKRCSAIEKSANLPKRRFVMEQMRFQHAQKDVSRQELCRQHAKTRFAIEKRAVNIPKRRLAIEKTCPQDATSN